MVPNNIIPSVMNYANSCTALKAAPSSEQVRAGVIPLDSLPAAWWNCMWYDTNRAVNCTRYGISSIVQEINSVLAATGRQVDQCCVNQLYESIEDIRQTIGTNLCAGAVKSSSVGGQVSIDGTTGIMTVNGVGNAALLTTVSHTIVNAVNELNQVYTGCVNALATNIDTADNIKANTMHAVAQVSYGVGNAADYGHLKISDVYDCCVGGVTEGLAASQKAVSDMYGYFASMVGGARACTNQVRACPCDVWLTYSHPCCSILAVTSTSGYSSIKGLTALPLNKYLHFPTGSVCFDYIQGTQFCSCASWGQTAQFNGTCSDQYHRYCGMIMGTEYALYRWNGNFGGNNAQLVGDVPLSGNCCILHNSLSFLASGPIPQNWELQCPLRRVSWYQQGVTCTSQNCYRGSLLYGGHWWGMPQSDDTYYTYSGCLFRDCRVGAMVYTFWRGLVMSNPINCTNTWTINGCPILWNNRAFCRIQAWDNPDILCGRNYVCGEYVGGNDGYYYPIYWVCGRRCYPVPHIHFNIYIQPLYTINSNYQAVDWTTICKPSAYLGQACKSPDSIWADSQDLVILNRCHTLGYCLCGTSMPFGSHFHHFFNHACCNTRMWLSCFRYWMNSNEFNNAPSYRFKNCIGCYASEYYVYACSGYASTGCYFGMCSQPPIIEFYIEE